jgi:serine phosphatase RsbU (regulator of sigma subunit)
MTKRFLIIILLFLPFTIFTQNKIIDSLETLLQKHTDIDTNRVNILNKAAYKLFSSDLSKTFLYASEADSLSDILNYKKGKAESIRMLGIYYDETSDYTKAMEFYQEALTRFTEIGDKTGMANSYNNIGIMHRVIGDNSRSMEYFQKAFKLYEETNDKNGMANSNNNIGIIFHDQGDLPKALKYYQNSFRISEELGDISGISNSYINIGIIYQEQKDYLQALECFQKSLEIAEKLGDKTNIILICINAGLLYSKMEIYTKATEYFRRGLKLSVEMGSKSLQGWNYYGLGSISLKQNKIDDAYRYSKIAFDIASEIGEVEVIKENSEILSKSCAAMGLYKEAYEYQLIFKSMSDSIKNEEITRKTIGLEYEFKYEREKELNRAEQEKIEAIHKEELKHQMKIRNYFIVGFALVLIVLALLFYNFIQKRKSNRLLFAQKKEIEEKNEELTQLNEEIRAQNDHLEKIYTEISEQKELIEKSHHQITESINYAKLIQNAVLPNKELVSMLIPEHFILFKPCEIVSGDFYFITQLKQYTLIAAADCTGHGVPGAFMSMLGIAFLNEIVRHSEIKTSAQVLTELRNKIKQSLQQSGEKGEQRDGMDIAFCAINIETLEMSFAGAHNPCWIFRTDVSKADKSQLIVIDADKTPVGVSAIEKQFTNYKFQLQKGDTLYLFTDGYHTQFGGEKKEKYQIKRLQTKLSQIQGRRLPEQKQILDSEFEKWKGDNAQTDDVLVLGVKFV